MALVVASSVTSAGEPFVDSHQRGTTIAVGVLAAVIVSAIGFSKGSGIVQWAVPIGIVLASVVWSFLPRRGAPGAGRESR